MSGLQEFLDKLEQEKQLSRVCVGKGDSHVGDTHRDE